jgi:hypothetical protein
MISGATTLHPFRHMAGLFAQEDDFLAPTIEPHLNTRTLACTDAPSVARLLIHAGEAAGGTGWSVESLIRRVRARCLDETRNEQAPLGLEIHDLQGNRVLTLDTAGPLVDVALPPGTYHVTTQLGDVRRKYTVALEQGASFDLHLRRSRDRC